MGFFLFGNISAVQQSIGMFAELGFQWKNWEKCEKSKKGHEHSVIL